MQARILPYTRAYYMLNERESVPHYVRYACYSGDAAARASRIYCIMGVSDVCKVFMLLLFLYTSFTFLCE